MWHSGNGGWAKRSVPTIGFAGSITIAYCGMMVGTAQERLCPPYDSAEIEKPADADGDQCGADHIDDEGKTDGRMQRRGHWPVGAVGIAVDDDLLIEVAVRIQSVGQANANQKDAEQADAEESQQPEQQHRKDADKEDRQQRQQQ